MAEELTPKEKDEAVLDRAAQMLTGGWSDSAYYQIFGAMSDVAFHSRGAGQGAYQKWARSLRSMGEVLISIAKREQDTL